MTQLRGRRNSQTAIPLAVGDSRPNPPAGWSWRFLRNLARLESGHTPSRYHREWWGGDVPWISLSGIRDLDGKIAYDTREHTNEQGIGNSSARILPKGTVVLSRTASVGFVTILGCEMATSQDFVNWVCGPDLDPRFLAYVFLGSREYLRRLSSGAIHQTIYMPTVEAFQVCAPQITEQRRIVRRLDEQLGVVERARAATEAQLEAAKALPAAFLRSLLDTPSVRTSSRRRLVDLVVSYRNGLSRRPSGLEEGPIVLRLADVSTGQISLRSPRRGAVTDEEMETYKLQAGDLLFIRVNGSRDLVGRCVMVPPLAEPVLYNDHLKRSSDSGQIVRGPLAWLGASCCRFSGDSGGHP